MKKNIIVFGASGMAGQTISKYLSKHHNVTKLCRQDYDVSRDTLPDLKQYDFVINCIGLIKQRTVNDEKLFYEINSDFPKLLAEKTDKLIHLSSDCVFSGNIDLHTSYYTHDIKDAIDAYGKSKSKGEVSNALVLRTSIIGPANNNLGLFEWFRSNINNEILGFTNHLWSGISTLELAKIINDIIINDNYHHSIKQISGEKISKYELLIYINNVFNLGKKVIKNINDNNINRSLFPDIQANTILNQLYELKEWMQNETC